VKSVLFRRPPQDVSGNYVAPEIRVFVSSTFIDLHSEREHLVKKVFPRLRRLCLERGVTFTEIDLRWGITEEEASQGNVVRVCLGEVDRCRPYFIGILADRYGWVPDAASMEALAKPAEAVPWLEEARSSGWSLTEIEIQRGVLGYPSGGSRALFYFRAPQDQPASDQSAADRNKLEKLKSRIRSNFAVREGFSDASTLGQWVHDDLMAIIAEDFPGREAPSPLERQRRAHEAFAATRRQAYVENRSDVARLDDFIAGDAPGLVVVGAPGSGKSSLLAHWVQRRWMRDPDSFVISHFVGAAGGDEAGIIRRVMSEIKQRYALVDELPVRPEAIVKEFGLWLARVDSEQLVLVIDALNQLEGVGLDLAWLPDYLPPNVRLIVSTLDDGVLRSLDTRMWQQLRLKPLDSKQREQLVTGYLAKYSKTLTAAQRERIATAQQCGNPLFLRTLLEELRVFGSFERLDPHIDHYLDSADPRQLFERVLVRLESDHGRAMVRALMAALWASRRGLKESEIIAITDCSRLALSTILAALEYHLMDRDGMLAFSHAFLRDAAEARYLNFDRARPELHARLASYFRTEPDSDRRFEELPWQLQQAGDLDGLCGFLAAPSTLAALSEEQKRYEILEYWLFVGERRHMVAIYRDSLERLSLTEHDREKLANTWGAVAAFCGLAGELDAAQDMLDEALALREEVWGSDHPQTASTLSDLAALLFRKGQFERAEELSRRALNIRETAFGADHLETAESLNNLGYMLARHGYYDAADPLLRRALGVREHSLGEDDLKVATTLLDLALVLIHKQEFDGAEQLLRRALDIRQRKLGRYHPATADGLNDLAYALAYKEDLGGAEQMFRRALDIRERGLGPNHLETAATVNNLGYVLMHKQQYDAAELLLRRAVTTWEKALSPNHPSVVQGLVNLGGLLAAKGSFGEALECVERGLSAARQTLGLEHPKTLEVQQELKRIRALGAAARKESSSASS